MAKPVPVNSKIRVVSERPPTGSAGKIQWQKFLCCDQLHIRLDNIRITPDVQTPVNAEKAYLLTGEGLSSAKCGEFCLYKDLNKGLYVVKVAAVSKVLPQNFQHALESQSKMPQTLRLTFDGKQKQLHVQLATPTAKTLDISYAIPSDTFLSYKKSGKHYYSGIHIGGGPEVLSHPENCNLDMTLTKLQIATQPRNSDDWHRAKLDFSDVQYSRVISGDHTDWVASYFRHNDLKAVIVQPKDIAKKNEQSEDESMDDELLQGHTGGGSSSQPSGYSRIHVVPDNPPDPPGGVGRFRPAKGEPEHQCCDKMHIHMANVIINTNVQMPGSARKAYLFMGGGPENRTKCTGFSLYKDLLDGQYVLKVASTPKYLPYRFNHALESEPKTPQTLQLNIDGKKQHVSITLKTKSEKTFEDSYWIPSSTFMPIGGIGGPNMKNSCNMPMTFTQIKLETLPHKATKMQTANFNFRDVKDNLIISDNPTDWVDSFFHDQGMYFNITQPKDSLEPVDENDDEKSMEDDLLEKHTGGGSGGSGKGSGGHSFQRENVDVKVDCATTGDKSKKKTWGSTYYAMLVVVLLVLTLGTVFRVLSSAKRMEKKFNNIVGGGQARGGLVQGGVSTL